MTELPFTSIHRHGLVRVGAARPRVTIADPAANADSIIALAQEAHARGADLVVFPELCVSAYAIDDLHLQQALLDLSEAAIARIVDASNDLRSVLLVGAPLRRNGRLYNCAIAIHAGTILGVVPKTFLPNYREFYEKRWFASGHDQCRATITVAGREAPFGVDLLFAAGNYADFCFHAEICEDLWSPTPPSTAGALAGATVLCNLSASNITIAKADERSLLCASQSNRCAAAYVYAAAGAGESTTDVAWDGQSVIFELGEEMAASKRFCRDPGVIYADVDVRRLALDRMRTGTHNDAASFAGQPETRFRRIQFNLDLQDGDTGLIRKLRRFPFVPNRPERLAQDCYEAFNIQVDGLVRRMEATKAKHLVIGISGGLDSTHALIVAAKACDLMGLPRSTILGYTMPGFATSEGTKANAWKLMQAMAVGAEEIDIRPAAQQMLADMRHPFAKGEKVYDITFENVQAGLRTDYLFRLANQHGGFVVGTGDLSELALGWATYGVGDHMSHYAVNTGVPKTLMQYLIRWTVESKQFDAETAEVLTAILDQEISPELVPADENGEMQSTEDKVGPYALNDFFLYYTLRQGQAPSKIAFLAWHAWRDRNLGNWPGAFPEKNKAEYDLPVIRHWLENFVHRFFVLSQFKRSAIPNGPKVLAGGSLSPRGDWRAPSDGTASAWMSDLATIPRS
ncbi:NAD(+) synthase [Sphingomonas piscis]|uniref:Glutamine-dependent NAD(+) synthetase n=1 Tax=Sphingomonas piscis TaxID=2714943 RepID=A0A6G7YMZ8_9SPHN|nr:NAD(+) synthase [Sphingomonas piscis]QIK78096.1 NAD(+) synthase [Sphingomonas piscis]